MGKKILLVDTDLRSTDSLTTRLGFESEVGLKNFLHQDNSNPSERDNKALENIPLSKLEPIKHLLHKSKAELQKQQQQINTEMQQSDLVLDYIKTFPSEENLFFLASGFNDLAIDPNKIDDSSNLLASLRMNLLMEKLKTHFDLVIYDLCAITGFADVNLLASKTNGVVLVTGLGKIQTMALTEALNQLRLCQAPILGVAVNKIVRQYPHS